MLSWIHKRQPDLRKKERKKKQRSIRSEAVWCCELSVLLEPTERARENQ